MGDNEESTKPLRESYERFIVLRRAMEKLGNPGFDLSVKGHK
jgi:hypothetical protein